MYKILNIHKNVDLYTYRIYLYVYNYKQLETVA